LRRLGCKGFVSKVDADRDLLCGVRAVLNGGEFFKSSPVPSQAAAYRPI